MNEARETYAEYLAFERKAETKHEFIDGQIVAMAGPPPSSAPTGEARWRCSGTHSSTALHDWGSWTR